VLVGLAKDDPETNARFAKFRDECERLGWLEGRNISIDYRFAPAGADVRDRVEELIALKPNVILAHTTPVATALRRKTSTIPIVFVNVSDPIGAGLADTIARPGGMLPGCCNTRRGFSVNGCTCSKRLRRALRALLSWLTLNCPAMTTSFDLR